MGFLSDIGQTIYDSGAHVFGYESYAEQERQEQGQQAQQLAQQQKNQLAQTNSGLDVAQFDKPGITECVNWSGFGHADIFQTNQDSIDAGRVSEVAQAWTELAGKLRERGENYATDVGKIVDGGWQGEAADKAREVGKPASDWMKASADAFEMTGNNLNGAGEAAGEASKMVPEPEGHSWGRTAKAAIPTGFLGAGVDSLAQMEKREEQERAAQETMGRVYSPALTQVDAKMPQYTKPDGSTAEPPAAEPGGGGPGGGMAGVGGGGAAGGGVPGGAAGGVGGVPGGAGGGGLPGGGQSGSLPGGPGSGDYSGPPASTSSQSATPPGGPGGMPPGAGAGAGGGAGAGAGAGGGAGAGMGGVAGMAGGPGGAGAGQPGPGGRAGAGGTGAGAGGGAGAGAARGAGAAGGRGAMGGGMGAGRGGQGQGGDEEHERPSWLEEQDDVWLEDMPRTAPPVLGE